MIIAEFNPQNKMVLFSDPLENFDQNGERAFASSEADAFKMVYFRNRKYIYETLSKWLKQRAHAIKDPEALIKINHLLYWLDTKQQSYYNLCAFINHKAGAFRSLAPGNKSRCFTYYEGTINRILNECKIQVN